MSRRAAVVVLDGVGCGAAHDAARYGDVGSDTLGNIARAVGGMQLPNLAALGLGEVADIPGLACDRPMGAHGTMQPRSPGKDSTTGHWELSGLILDRPFPTYPTGFPPEVISAFERLTNRSVIGNVVGSGTAVLDQYAARQRETGGWIVYTSADSVFQIAAHEEVIPLDELYSACAVARDLLSAPHNVSRVIARPFVGGEGAYRRTPNRRDYSLAPVGETLLDALRDAGVERAGVGKVDDLFAHRAITSQHTRDNAEGIECVRSWLAESAGGFLFANLVDFDQQYGHRNDIQGFYGALRQFDDALPALLSLLRKDDLFVITADHGNDPTTSSTDHARERVPVLMVGASLRSARLAERDSFADLGATLGEWFRLPFRGHGRSFLAEILA